MEHTCILISSGDLRLSNRCKQFVHPACFVLVLSILEFPCNQFMNQAPGNDEKLHTFCKGRFGPADVPEKFEDAVKKAVEKIGRI